MKKQQPKRSTTKVNQQSSEATTKLQASGLLENIPKWAPPDSPTSWWPANPGPNAPFPESTIPGSMEQAQAKNDNAINLYYHQADSFTRSNTAGKVSPTPWPTVPNAAGVQQSESEAYVMVPDVGTPVCDPLPQPGDNTADEATRFASVPLGTVDIGTAMEAGAQSGFFRLGPKDRTKVGTSTTGTSADGVSGTFTRISTPVSQWSGPRAVYGGYYEKAK